MASARAAFGCVGWLGLSCALSGLLAATGCDSEANASSAPAASAARVTPATSASTKTMAVGPSAPSNASAEEPPAKPKEPQGSRVYAKSRFVWIREVPDASKQWIGYLWTGGSVKLKSENPVHGPGCMEWYAIEPKGYVCVDGKRATLDAKDPGLEALQPYLAKLDSPWPHQYGESRGLQRYNALPDEKLQRQREWDVTQHLEKVAAVRDGEEPGRLLKGVDLTPAKDKLDADPFQLVDLPNTIHEPRTRLLPNSTVAYSTEVRKDGRDWLLTADMTWVPKDRVAPYPKVTFEGVHLGKDAKLPLAFFRGKDQPQYDKVESGFEPNGKTFARLSFVELTGRREKHEEDVFLETKQAGIWIKESEAVVPTPRELTPWGTRVGSDTTTTDDPNKKLPEGRATWLEASVWQGWLIAYEGNTPVYATMISPGRGGVPVPGKDPLETASTPVGTYPITGKFATATMEAPGEFIHSDVPWTQNFHGPHALHGAYWHDDWGKLKSAGCVNVSPRDGKWLYEFTEPKVPDGWHGVRWLPYAGPATLFVVHE